MPNIKKGNNQVFTKELCYRIANRILTSEFYKIPEQTVKVTLSVIFVKIKLFSSLAYMGGF